MKDLLKNYFNWHGRLSRTGYMWSWAGILAVDASLIFIRKAVLFLVFFLYPYHELISEIITYAIRIWNIVMFPPILFATMRRYHDSGNAGWKVIILGLLSSIFITSGLFIGCFVIIGFVFAGGYMVTAETNVNMAGFLGYVVLSAFLLLAGIIFCIVNIKYIFRQSDPEENIYGKPIPYNPPERG